VNLLFAVLALVGLVGAFFSFRSFQATGNTTMFILTVVCVLVALGFGGVFLARKMSNKEEIHITE
jgi:uncharacterized protein YneF (UPF0154 family)